MQKPTMARKLTILLLVAALLLTVAAGCQKKEPDASSGGYGTSEASFAIAETSSDVQMEPDVPTDSSAADNPATSPKGDDGKTNTETSSRPIASNAISAPPPKAEVSLPEETQIQIKPVKDAVMKETIKNMGGKTFEMATFYPQYYEIGADPNAALRMEAFASIEKDYNCKIEIKVLNPNTYTTVINTAKAGGELYANIYEAQKGFGDTLARSGILADLRTVNSVDLSGNEWNPGFTLDGTFNGGIYGIGVDRTKLNYECIFFNKNIAEQYGLGDFYELVKTKQWTFETFFNISQEVYLKSNRRIYGMFTYSQQKTGEFVFANDSSPLVIQNDKVIFNYQDPKHLRALDFVQQYSEMGAINLSKFEHIKEINPNQDFTDGNCLFFTAWSNLAVMDFSRSMQDDYGILPFPIGPDASDYKGILCDSYYSGLANDDPAIEDAGMILVAIANRTNVPIAEIDRQMAPYLRDQESLEMLHLLMTSDISMIPGTRCLKDDYYEKVIPDIVLGKQTPKQALDAVAKAVQAEVDEFYMN